MTGSAWVPPGTPSPALDRDLTAMACAWSEAWFGHPLSLRDSVQGERFHVLGEDVAIGVAGEDLGVLALGSRFAGPRSTADRALIDRLSDAVREDLQRRVAMALDCTGDWSAPVERLPWVPARVLTFGDATGRLSLSLALGARCLAAAILARLPAVAVPDRPLTPLSQAIAGRGVRLSARLGHCALRLADMREMVVGDTMLFDRHVDDALPVVIDDAATGIATARVVREPACWALRIDDSRVEQAA